MQENAVLLHILSYLPTMRDVAALALTSKDWYERLRDMLPVDKSKLIAIATAVRFMPEFAGQLNRVAQLLSGWDASSIRAKFHQLPAVVGIEAKRLEIFAHQHYHKELVAIDLMPSESIEEAVATIPNMKSANLVRQRRERKAIDIINRHLVRNDLDMLKSGMYTARMFETHKKETLLPARVQLKAGPNESLLATIQYQGEHGCHTFFFDKDTKHWRCRELYAFDTVFDISLSIIRPNMFIRTA